MRYDVLRRYAAASGGVIQRLNTYIPFDHERREQDPEYKGKQDQFIRKIRQMGWRVYEKEVKRYPQEDGSVAIKANADMELAIDAITESSRLDLVVLVSGDGDFTRLAQALQAKGCRVEVVAFRHISRELREASDLFINGYLIPELVPIRESTVPWGQEGSIVRGVIEYWNEEKHHGFVRFLTEITDRAWDVDQRTVNSPYSRCFIGIGSFLDERSNGLDIYRSQRVLQFKVEKNRQVDPPFMVREAVIIES